MPTNVVTLNLLAGAGQLWTGSFGAAEPADPITAPAGPDWTPVGGTDGGVTADVSQTFLELKVDQIQWKVGRQRTGLDCTVKTSLAEITLANLMLSLNGGTLDTAGLTFDQYEPPSGTDNGVMAYKALLFRGVAPSGKVRQLVVRKVLSIDNIGKAYKKDAQTLIPVTFGAHWVSDAIAPFRYQDSK